MYIIIFEYWPDLTKIQNIFNNNHLYYNNYNIHQ